MSGLRSFRATSADRSMSERLVPCATAATVPIEQGQITIPALFTDPDAGSAPRSLVVEDFYRGPVPAGSLGQLAAIPHLTLFGQQACQPVGRDQQPGRDMVGGKHLEQPDRVGRPGRNLVSASVTGRRSTTGPSPIWCGTPHWMANGGAGGAGSGRSLFDGGRRSQDFPRPLPLPTPLFLFHRIRSTREARKTVIEMTPFIVKNAALSLERSPGLTR